MSYELSWIIPGRVICTKRNQMTEDEQLRAWDNEMVNLLEDVTSDAALIHHILVVDKTVQPPGLKMMTSLAFTRHARYGWTMVVGVSTNPLLRVVGRLAGQVLRLRVREVNSIDEAMQFLYTVDTTIPRKTADV